MGYLIHLIILFAIYAILGVSLNLIVGYTGLMSINHAAFYGIGAYTTAILLTQTQTGFSLSVIFGMFISFIISFIIGLILFRFKEDYCVLGSFGFNIIVFSIFLNWISLTKGPLGIAGISRPILFNIDFSDNLCFMFLTLSFLTVIYFVSSFIVNSSFGRVLRAIREDEIVVEVFGYDILRYKLTIFIISAMMAGIAGSLFASYITFIDPTGFAPAESILILSMTILGGLSNLRGSILGALFLVFLPEFLRFVGFPTEIAAQMRQVVYGLSLVLLMLYRPRGLIGEYEL